jgi:TetR/AcrR family acrAB operon transcriptional repressor
MADSGNQERADRILDAAAKLIVHYGYDKTTVSDIAHEAGVSKGAIYLHWKSKEDLFEALVFREAETVTQDMLARIEADPDAGSIFAFYQHAMVVAIENPLMHAVLTRDTRILGDFMRHWMKANPNMANEGQFFRTEMVRQLQEAHVIRDDLDVDIVSYILTLIRYGFLTVHDVVPDDQTPPLMEVGKTLGMLLERALAPDDGVDREAGKRVLENTLQTLRDYVGRMREAKG